LHKPTKEERSVPLKALNRKLDMPGSIDIACERAIPCQRGTYFELAADIPLVLLHGEMHACVDARGRVIDDTTVCPGYIWINRRLLTRQRRTARSTRSTRNNEPHNTSANEKQESKE
jgi:hypothetical protein